MIEDRVVQLKSQYGFTWKAIDRDYDQMLGVRGGETHIVELKSNEILAIKRGFAFVKQGGGICPQGKTEESLYKFVSQVLKPPIAVSAK